MPSLQDRVRPAAADTDPNSVAAAPLDATSAIPTPRSDPMVAPARWEPQSILGPARREWPRDPRPRSMNPGPGRPIALRPGAVAAGPRRHTVARGETFPSIARLYYGSERYGQALWQFNRGRFPRPGQLTPGDLLVIPAIEELDTSADRPELPVHVVRRHETLRSIARERLGDARRADEIIELNRERLGGAGQLTPGQRLVLPLDAGPARPAP